jgi:hypothetical protein
MSNLKIEDLKPEQAQKRNFAEHDITLKRDGTLIFFKNGKLFSPRCERSDRFKHILNILKANNFPDCYGEMYIEGGCVFDVSRSENWSKAKFMPIDFESNLSYSQKQALLKQLVTEVKSEFITPLMKFETFEEGWDYVKKNESEGLVIRNSCEWFKVKALKEVKIEISSHEPSKEKGTFVLINGNRVSGTSREFVQKFKDIKASGKIPIAEIEYPFLTAEGSYFQPRLRRVFIKGEGENGD